MNKKFASLLIAITLLIITFFAINQYRKSTRNIVDLIASKNDLVNVLVSGINSYKEDTYVFFAVISVNPANGNCGITLIPPDYGVCMNDDGSKMKKISDVDFYYYSRIRYSLKKDLGLDVPFYINIYSPDVERTVDLLGGVNIFSIDQASCVSNINFGLNYLDGNKTMQYINCTKDNSIFIKYDRILDVILSLYHDKKLWSLFKNYDFIGEVFKSIKTNMLLREIFSIADTLRDDGQFYSSLMPGGYVNSYYQVDEISLKSYQHEFLTPIAVENSPALDIKIKILNGTSVPGLARQLRNSLIKDGLNVVEFGTSAYPPMTESVIICRKSDFFAAGSVSKNTGINNIYFVNDSTQLNNLLIIIGEDYAR